MTNKAGLIRVILLFSFELAILQLSEKKGRLWDVVVVVLLVDKVDGGCFRERKRVKYLERQNTETAQEPRWQCFEALEYQK